MSEKSFLKYEITGGEAFAAVKIILDKPGQQVIGDGGAMIYMTGNVNMTTKSSGGIMKGLKRSFSGESMFQNYFELTQGSEGYVVFSPGVPGSIVHMHLTQGDQWTLSKGAYICGTPSVQVSTRRGGIKQMFGGEGYFLTDISTEAEGDVWMGGYGFIERHDIRDGEEFIVDNGVMLAFTSNMPYSLTKVGGKKSFILGGEGVVIKYTGPGVVYTQNRDMSALASLLQPFFPNRR